MKKISKLFLNILLTVGTLFVTSCQNESITSKNFQNYLDQHTESVNLSTDDFTLEYNEVVTIYSQKITGGDSKYNMKNASIMVKGKSASLTNLTAIKEVIVDSSVGEGDFTLENCDVEKLTVNGGGANSIHINNITVVSVSVNKEGVRLVLEGTTTIKDLNVNSNCALETVVGSSATISHMKVDDSVKSIEFKSNVNIENVEKIPDSIEIKTAEGVKTPEAVSKAVTALKEQKKENKKEPENQPPVEIVLTDSSAHMKLENSESGISVTLKMLPGEENWAPTSVTIMEDSAPLPYYFSLTQNGIIVIDTSHAELAFTFPFVKEGKKYTFTLNDSNTSYESCIIEANKTSELQIDATKLKNNLLDAKAIYTEENGQRIIRISADAKDIFIGGTPTYIEVCANLFGVENPGTNQQLLWWLNNYSSDYSDLIGSGVDINTTTLWNGQFLKILSVYKHLLFRPHLQFCMEEFSMSRGCYVITFQNTPIYDFTPVEYTGCSMLIKNIPRNVNRIHISRKKSNETEYKYTGWIQVFAGDRFSTNLIYYNDPFVNENETYNYKVTFVDTQANNGWNYLYDQEIYINNSADFYANSGYGDISITEPLPMYTLDGTTIKLQNEIKISPDLSIPYFEKLVFYELESTAGDSYGGVATSSYNAEVDISSLFNWIHGETCIFTGIASTYKYTDNIFNYWYYGKFYSLNGNKTEIIFPPKDE